MVDAGRPNDLIVDIRKGSPLGDCLTEITAWISISILGFSSSCGFLDAAPKVNCISRANKSCVFPPPMQLTCGLYPMSCLLGWFGNLSTQPSGLLSSPDQSVVAEPYKSPR